MRSELAKRVFRDLQHTSMIHAGDRVGVAVSGGADSVSLLRLLEELATDLGIRLAVVHFNHQLRGAESDADERFVASLAAERGWSFFVDREDVAAVADRERWNIEDAGRRLRYSYFASLVRAEKLDRIAVGHTADDQAETVLARLIRGTGPAGIAAIYPTRQIRNDFDEGQLSGRATLVRPLLGIRRAELRAYLGCLGQEWREDASNENTQRLRARLRHQLLPLIERELQPAIVSHLCRLAQLAREDQAFWSVAIADRLRELVHEENGALTIRCADLLAPFSFIGGLSNDGQSAVSGRLVRGLVEMLVGDTRQLTSEHVGRVISLARTGASGKRCDLPGVQVRRSFEWLWFHPAPGAIGKLPCGTRDAPDSAQAASSRQGYSHRLDLGRPGDCTVVAIPEIGRRFSLKVIDWTGRQREDRKDEEFVLDRDLLQTPLVLRSWHPGDSFRPRGRQGAHKLKQFLRVGRVAVWDRANWPVLTSGGELAWVRGLPVAAKFAPRPGTRIGVLITEEEA